MLFIKFGGSVLTDKNAPESLATDTLDTVAQQIATIRRDQPDLPLLIGHGGGSFGHYWAERYQTAQGIINDQSWWGVVRVADAMARLNRAVVHALIAANVPALGVQPLASARSAGRMITSIGHEQIATLLKHGIVPVVYGDVVLDDQQGCTIASTETIFAALAQHIPPTSIILVGEQAVFEADPRTNPDAQIIPLINSDNYHAIVDFLAGSHGVDVTGGMKSKVEAMWQLVNHLPNAKIIICAPAMLERAAADQPFVGTTIRL